jgi:hypothetical protein
MSPTSPPRYAARSTPGSRCRSRSRCQRRRDGRDARGGDPAGARPFGGRAMLRRTGQCCSASAALICTRRPCQALAGDRRARGNAGGKFFAGKLARPACTAHQHHPVAAQLGVLDRQAPHAPARRLCRLCPPQTLITAHFGKARRPSPSAYTACPAMW